MIIMKYVMLEFFFNIGRNNFKHKIGIIILLNPAFKKSHPVQTYQTYTLYFGPDFLYKVGIKNKILDRV